MSLVNVLLLGPIRWPSPVNDDEEEKLCHSSASRDDGATPKIRPIVT